MIGKTVRVPYLVIDGESLLALDDAADYDREMLPSMIVIMTRKLFYSQTFASAYKASLVHYKTEVSAGFVIYIIDRLLKQHNVSPVSFRDDLKLRFNSGSPLDLEAKGFTHMHAFLGNNAEPAVTNKPLPLVGIAFSSKAASEILIGGIRSDASIPAHQVFSGWLRDYTAQRRDWYGIPPRDEVLMPKLTITEVTQVGGLLSFATDKEALNQLLDRWFSVIRTRVQQKNQAQIISTLAASIDDMKLLVQPDQEYPMATDGLQQPICDDMSKFLEACRELLFAHPIPPRSIHLDALNTIRGVVGFLVMDLTRRRKDGAAGIPMLNLTEEVLLSLAVKYGDLPVWKRGEPSERFFRLYDGGQMYPHLMSAATAVFMDADHQIGAGRVQLETATVSAHLYNMKAETFQCDEIRKVRRCLK